MAKYYVAYSKSICYKYKANLRSSVTVFLIFNAFFCFILPFILSYNSKGFWIKQFWYREQPIIKFKYHYLILLENEVAGFAAPTIMCSTFQNLDPEYIFSDNCSLVKVIERDENSDGITDHWQMSVHVTDVISVDIKAIQLFLIFDYKIHTECMLELEAMLTTSKVFPHPAGQISVFGELDTNIKRPIRCNTRHKRSNHSVLALQDDKFNAIGQIISSYGKHSVNINLKNQRYVTKHKNEIAVNEPVVINVEIQYTEQSITYKTPFWQLVKWAWIQYFSLLGLFIIISKKMKKFVFQNRVLQTIKTNSLEESY